MGFMMFTQNFVIEPEKLGFKIGQKFTVTCVGGGGAGGSCVYKNKLGGNAGWTGTRVSNQAGGGGGGFGSGGGGAGGAVNSINNAGTYYYKGSGGGGGGSGYVEQKTFVLENLLPIAVTVGAGGIATLDNDGDGGNGGTTSFGNILSAKGGGGGKGSSNNYTTGTAMGGGIGRFNGDNGYYNNGGNGAGGYIYHMSDLFDFGNTILNYNNNITVNGYAKISNANNNQIYLDYMRGGKGPLFLATTTGGPTSYSASTFGSYQGAGYPVPHLCGQGVIYLEW